MKASRKIDGAAALLVTACSLALAAPAFAGDTIDFTGYGRAGISTTGNGGQQSNYGNGSTGHYVGRLGDETDTYAELALGKLFTLDGGQTLQVNSMVSYSTNNGAQLGDYQSYTEPGSTTSQGDISFRQMNVIGRGFLPFDPGAALWAGKRYYKREGIDLLDLFYLNNSGYGAGIEDVNVGFGKFSAAWIANQTQSFTGQPNSGGQPYVQVNNLDLRLEQIALSRQVSLSFAVLLGKGSPDGQQSLAGEPTQTGSFCNGELHWQTDGGSHTFVAQYGLHGMANFAWLNQSGEEVQSIAPNWGGDLKSATRFILYGEQNFAGNLGLSYSLLHADGQTASTTGIPETRPTRTSAVLAPFCRENAYTRTILELGGERYQEASASVSHSLYKVMLAQELRLAKAKVVDIKIRAYTGAFYGTDAASNTLVDPKGDKGNIRFGVQMAGSW